MQKIIISFIILFSVKIGFSQINPQVCKDTLQISYALYPCPEYPEYFPVCGCDGVTYKNSCYALKTAGIQIFTNGVCGIFGFDYYPNLISSDNPILNLYLIAKYETDITFQIIDAYGKNWYEYTFRKVNDILRPEQINLSFLPKGIYYVLGFNSGEYHIKSLLII